MKNKIVIFSNIKGGVGKTTLCALFASYLVERGYPVMAIDADLQASLYRHRKRSNPVERGFAGHGKPGTTGAYHGQTERGAGSCPHRLPG